MSLAKSKIAAAVLVTVGLAAGSAGLRSRPSLAAEEKSAGHEESEHAVAEPGKIRPPLDFSSMDKRVDEIQPTSKEKRFEEIGWAKGLRDAERLAKENHRPVFLFSNVGQMDLGRC